MANYRKSFNFRNGVQVDEDNLIVNSNGLVGIGTSVPTEILDVRGTTKVVGLVTANQIFTPALNVSGVGTFGTISDGKITISSGIITSVSGFVTFYGDGKGLFNIPTSQWVDIDVGLGFTSIYAAGNVGIATVDPRYTFQVGANPNTGNGVGFNSTGSIKASGIITASSFVGDYLSGNLLGNVFTVNLGNTATAIINGGGNAVGNIGSSSKYFNQVFAQATTALYADLAEVYAADADYAPGTVLVFGGNQEVTISTTDSSRRVAGVISENPSYLMNSGCF